MLQQKQVQSPARLGLTNPTSPSPAPSSSVQNPTPPKPLSSTLLSLLPPLPRAQSLLQQLASLSSKLFDLSPNRALWLSSFRGHLPTFLSSQAPLPSSDLSSLKDALTLFSSLQSQLFLAVSELQQILDLQENTQRISRDIHALDSNLLAFASKLKEAERVLDILVDDYLDYRKPKRIKLTGDDVTETTISNKVKLSDILSYAHRISYTTFAPPEFGAGTAPLRGAMPPAPQEEQMRASQLYTFADLDVGLPKLDESKERTIDAMIEAPAPQNMEGNMLGSLANLLPPNITVPSGWKPGMPVVLPKDLPVPPPGWKPGDPLPPLESLPVPRIVEPQQNAVGVAKQPETIQVRHVQIDILDQDDDSSDYSSDEGSSDDED